MSDDHDVDRAAQVDLERILGDIRSASEGIRLLDAAARRQIHADPAAFTRSLIAERLFTSTTPASVSGPAVVFLAPPAGASARVIDLDAERRRRRPRPVPKEPPRGA